VAEKCWKRKKLNQAEEEDGVQIQCPGCLKTVDIDQNRAGEVIPCPHCQVQMQVPALEPEAVSQPSTPVTSLSQNSSETKGCPFCGETVLKIARKCKHCKEDIPAGLDTESIRKRLEAKETIIKEKGCQVIPYSVGGKIRTGTFIVVGITVASIIAIVVGVNAPGNDLLGLTVTGFIFGIIFGIATLVFLGNDLLIPSASARNTPERGFKAFLHSVRIARFGYAYACVLEGDKDDTKREVVKMDKVQLDYSPYSFANLKGFKQYWKGICRASRGQSRRMTISKVRLEQLEGEYALVSAQVQLHSYPSLLALLILLNFIIAVIVIMAMTKHEKIVLTKLLRKVDGQWYVVNGELLSGEDRFQISSTDVPEARPLK
jgi:ribosomal protein L37AE/L43A